MNSCLIMPLGDLPEDVNHDGFVDQADLLLVINSSQQQQQICPIGEICWCDVNGDYRINIDDVGLVMRAFGPCGDPWGQGYEAYLDVWMVSGGEQGLDSGNITTTEVAGSLEQPTPVEKIVSLYSLIGQ
jgi:hypothetical protein